MHSTARLILVVVTLLVAACSGALPSGLPANPLAAGPLVTVETRGGECAGGPCGGKTAIERDGRIHQTLPVAADLGTLPPELLTALDALIKTTDFTILKARPFTGECPVAFDGQEYIYEFGAPGGMQRIATCEVEVDPGHPLFLAVEAAMAAAAGR